MLFLSNPSPFLTIPLLFTDLPSFCCSAHCPADLCLCEATMSSQLHSFADMRSSDRGPSVAVPLCSTPLRFRSAACVTVPLLCHLLPFLCSTLYSNSLAFRFYAMPLPTYQYDSILCHCEANLHATFPFHCRSYRLRAVANQFVDNQRQSGAL